MPSTPVTASKPPENAVVCVVGPTASGKSDVAQEIACRINGEVLSADSMQIYKRMDIGTGKVLPNVQRVTHFGLNLIEPGEAYSAALFQDYARSCFADIAARGKRAVLAGGTGLYVRAAIDGYDFPKGEQVNNLVRETYTAYAEEYGAEALWQLLQEKDPESAAVLHPNNVRRVVRAFELLAEGKTYAEQKRNLAVIPQEIPAVFIGLAVNPDILRARIDGRVDAMIEQGLVEEVKALLNAGFREGITAPQAIGYKEIVAYLEGACTLAQAIEQIKVATHRYAKRQRTWFRKDTRINWLNADDGNIERLGAEALNFL